MKRGTILSVLLISFFISYSQEESALSIYGDLKTDQRIILGENSQWAWNENRVTLKVAKKGERGKFYAEFWVRNFGIPNYEKADDLFNKGILDPFDFQIREAYYQISDLFVKNLDLKIGRQRIRWGSADQFNPTDNLNPFDMEDLFDFGRARGSDAINLTYYIKNDYSLQAVFIPFFQPANMPVGIFSNALIPAIETPQNITINSITTSFSKPKLNIKESSTLGIKFKGSIKSVDFSISYLNGIDGIPYVTQTTISPVIYPFGVNIDVQMSYSRTHIFGIDFASNIKGVGIWGEAAIFMIEDSLFYRTITNPLLPISDPTVSDSLILSNNTPFFKFILGADYHFGKGSYINIQFLHGFLHERGKEHLKDYLFVRYDQKILDDKITFSPISGAFMVTDWTHLSENFCIMYAPQIAYNPIPDFQLTLAAAIIYGKGSGIFTMLQDFDQMILKATYSF